ncbi:MAG: protease complex subunit PrcB family protein [Candidatus Wallbacteria bacterium]|nr:protease complex subunit PrcB family protein [Candidatus Wallbacteria bacterium]
MIPMIRVAAAALCAATLLAGAAAADERSTLPMIATTAQSLEFEVVRAGPNAFGRQGPAETVIHTKLEWEEVWKSIASTSVPRPPAPEIDFGKRTLVAVFMGEKPTGGYRIEVRSVRRSPDGKKLLVDVVEKQPAKGAILTQAFTSPYQVIGVAAGDFTLEVTRTRQ